MGKVLIFSDPHLGLRRKANTSMASSMRLQQKLLSMAIKAGTKMKNDLECSWSFCLGDLFDTYRNPEHVIKDAASAISQVDMVLAGNHDLENRAESIGSLQLLSSMLPDNHKFVINSLGEAESYHVSHGTTSFLSVPHTATQELFENALDDAAGFASTLEGKWKILLLHCNYHLSYENLPDTSINLTKEKTDELLQTFHKIFIGHEHIPAEHYDGRVIIVGNTFPTGFSDISDKRVLTYDTETGEHESHVLWESDAFAGNASEAAAHASHGAFLDLVDDLPPGEASKLVTSLFKEDNVMAVRLRSEAQNRIKGEKLSAASLQSLPEVISEDLKHTDQELFSVWKELSHGNS